MVLKINDFDQDKNKGKLMLDKTPAHNFSYPSSAAAVVFGVHLSAQAVFRLDRKSPAPDSYRGPHLRVASYVNIIIKR
jgi:hypothetical protein